MRINVSAGTCEGVTFAYLKNGHPAYSGIMSVFLAAQATGVEVTVVVKESNGIYSNSREIEWVVK